MGKTNSESRNLGEPQERKLRDDELAFVSGGNKRPDGTAGGNVAAKWNVAQGHAA